MKKFTILTTHLLCIWTIIAIVQLSDAKTNKTLEIPLTKLKKPSRHLRKREATSLSLQSVDNDFFFGAIACGTPPQYLRVIFDTGSSDVWVMSALLCKEDARICGSCGHHTYDSKKSSTFRNMNQKWSIDYMDGSTFSGRWCEDSMTIGNHIIQNQIFAEATYGKQEDPCTAYDGICGLGYHDVYRETCAFRNMMRQGLVDQPVFSFYLSRMCDDSKLILGGSDPKYYTGRMVQTEVVDPNSWTIEFTSARIGNQQVMGRCEALVDSGTSLILCPTDFMNAFKKMAGDPSELDCSDMDYLPQIIFEIGKGHRFIMDPPDYMLMEEADEQYDAECVCGIDSSDGDQFILGNVFMCKFYTMFNMAEGVVGVALAKHCDTEGSDYS